MEKENIDSRRAWWVAGMLCACGTVLTLYSLYEIAYRRGWDSSAELHRTAYWADGVLQCQDRDKCERSKDRALMLAEQFRERAGR